MFACSAAASIHDSESDVYIPCTLPRTLQKRTITYTVDILRETIRAVLEQYVLEEDMDPLKYERLVIRCLKDAGICGRIKQASAHNAWKPDAEMVVNDDFHYVEIKSSTRAQMGGGSVAYSDGMFFAAGTNIEMSQAMADVLNDTHDTSLRRNIDTFLRLLSGRRRSYDSIPISSIDEERWKALKAKGALKNISRTFNSGVEAIAQHYARKNTYYIQIHGAGLFRLSEANPANLPVPVLTGRVNLEVRLGKSKKPSNNTAGLRVQARLITKSTSPYTLDDVDSILNMLRSKPKRRSR